MLSARYLSATLVCYFIFACSKSSHDTSSDASSGDAGSSGSASGGTASGGAGGAGTSGGSGDTIASGGSGGTTASGGTGGTTASGGTGGTTASGGSGGTTASGGSGGTIASGGGGTGNSSTSGGSGGTNASGGSAGMGGQVTTFDDLPQEIQTHCDRMENYACEMFKACHGWTTCDQHPVSFLHEFCHERLPGLWAEGYYSFDAELAETCLPDRTTCVGRWADLFDTHSCRNVFRGTLAPGEDCYNVGWIFGSPCSDGRCVMDGQTCPGKCQTYAAEGESCDSIPCAPGAKCKEGLCVQPPEWNEPCTDDCVGSLICSDAGGEKVCQGAGLVGEACSESRACASPLVCKDSVCVDHVELGDACTTSAVCPSGASCYPTATDDPNTCNPTKGEGEACDLDAECGTSDVNCVDPDLNDADFGRVCAALSGVGGPCEPAGCKSPLWCRYTAASGDDGVCQLPGGIGDSCASEAGQRSGAVYPCLWDGTTHLYCIEDECRVAPELGEACNPDDHDVAACAEGWCAFASRQCEAPVAEGKACNPDARDLACEDGAYCDCASEPCDDASDSGVCIAKKANSALCTNWFECQSDYCGVDRCEDAPVVCSPE